MTRRGALDVLDDPATELIDEIRRRFPTERETDELLTRKMRRRSGPPYVPVTVDQLRGGLERLLSEKLSGDFEIVNARWFTGGASKIQMGFDLHWEDPARGPVT